MRLVHLELRDANAFVTELHRHHKKVQGHRFMAEHLSERKQLWFRPLDDATRLAAKR